MVTSHASPTLGHVALPHIMQHHSSTSIRRPSSRGSSGRNTPSTTSGLIGDDGEWHDPGYTDSLRTMRAQIEQGSSSSSSHKMSSPHMYPRAPLASVGSSSTTAARRGSMLSSNHTSYYDARADSSNEELSSEEDNEDSILARHGSRRLPGSSAFGARRRELSNQSVPGSHWRPSSAAGLRPGSRPGSSGISTAPSSPSPKPLEFFDSAPYTASPSPAQAATSTAHRRVSGSFRLGRGREQRHSPVVNQLDDWQGSFTGLVDVQREASRSRRPSVDGEGLSGLRISRPVSPAFSQCSGVDAASSDTGLGAGAPSGEASPHNATSINSPGTSRKHRPSSRGSARHTAPSVALLETAASRLVSKKLSSKRRGSDASTSTRPDVSVAGVSRSPPINNASGSQPLGASPPIPAIVAAGVDGSPTLIKQPSTNAMGLAQGEGSPKGHSNLTRRLSTSTTSSQSSLSGLRRDNSLTRRHSQLQQRSPRLLPNELLTPLCEHGAYRQHCDESALADAEGSQMPRYPQALGLALAVNGPLDSTQSSARSRGNSLQQDATSLRPPSYSSRGSQPGKVSLDGHRSLDPETLRSGEHRRSRDLRPATAATISPQSLAKTTGDLSLDGSTSTSHRDAEGTLRAKPSATASPSSPRNEARPSLLRASGLPSPFSQGTFGRRNRVDSIHARQEQQQDASQPGRVEYLCSPAASMSSRSLSPASSSISFSLTTPESPPAQMAGGSTPSSYTSPCLLERVVSPGGGSVHVASGTGGSTKTMRRKMQNIGLGLRFKAMQAERKWRSKFGEGGDGDGEAARPVEV